MASVSRLVRKMRKVVRDIEDANGTDGPALPVPAFASEGACMDYMAVVRAGNYFRYRPDDALFSEILALARTIRKSDPDDVRTAWDVVLVESVMAS